MVAWMAPLGAVGVTALLAGRSLAGEGLGALGATGDRPHPGRGAGRAALGVQLGHRGGTQGGVLLGAADPPEPLRLRAGPDGQHILVELEEHGVQAASSLAAALTLPRCSASANASRARSGSRAYWEVRGRPG